MTSLREAHNNGDCSGNCEICQIEGEERCIRCDVTRDEHTDSDHRFQEYQ